MSMSKHGVAGMAIHGPGAPWVKQLLFYLLCAFAALMFIPCMIPCFIRLIHSVVQGMQISAIPMDPELARGGEVHPLMIVKIKKTEHPNPIQQTLARFETKTRINLIKQKARDCEE